MFDLAYSQLLDMNQELRSKLQDEIFIGAGPLRLDSLDLIPFLGLDFLDLIVPAPSWIELLGFNHKCQLPSWIVTSAFGLDWIDKFCIEPFGYSFSFFVDSLFQP
ncbi:hypothetical protein RhiirA4_453240 [Rhizophagus irregularis]|uniref:Uncharacterized protein n=1 Tax=Rhizophagus irregularis TaxID=588596 RepID=A0A2I1G023_9GLOM|nr:hypothetical protein RhiirA4_453240 [Rhizophagus irregularis]